MDIQIEKDIEKSIKEFLNLKKKELKTKIIDILIENDIIYKTILLIDKSYSKIKITPEFTYKTYDFEIDTFQKIGFSVIEKNESIIISAQTACGKTLVGEYAIARALYTNSKAIYLTPLELLSKQKYDEFTKKFEDVGLITENLIINEKGKCLVMTTNAFRNIICKNNKYMSDVKWIIYDEIHYITKGKNGIDCEESIMMLPSHINIVFLSATIANIIEFGTWICNLLQKSIHVIITKNRVIPLEHYFCSDKMYLVENGKLHEEHYWKIMKNALNPENANKKVLELAKKVTLPSIFFANTAKICFEYAKSLKTQFINYEELKQIEDLVIQVMIQIKDKSILNELLPLLKQGIGIHCDEMIPLVRDLVQILFEKSLIKIVFATETFSIGLNMPVKTVVFTSLMKDIGNKKRILNSSEYIQMSGRAGRRGMESKGIAISIIRNDQPFVPPENLFCSCTSYLNSAFKLRYKMILDNLQYKTNFDFKTMIDKSFNAYQSYIQCLLIERAIIKNIEIMKKLENEIKNDSSINFKILYEKLLRREKLLCERNSRFIKKFNKILQKEECIVDLIIPRCGATLKVKGLDLQKYENEQVFGFLMTNLGIKYLKFPKKYITAIYLKNKNTDINNYLKINNYNIIEKIENKNEIKNEIEICKKKIMNTISEEIDQTFSIYENNSDEEHYTIEHSAKHTKIYNDITLYNSKIKKSKNILRNKNENELKNKKLTKKELQDKMIKELEKKMILEKKLNDIKMLENKSVNEIVKEFKDEIILKNEIKSKSIISTDKFENNFLNLIYKDKVDDEILFLEKSLKKEFGDINFDKCFFCNENASSCLVSCIIKKCNNQKLKKTLRLCQLNSVKNRIEILLEKIHKFKNNSYIDDLNNKLIVLKKLNYINNSNILEQKGKAALEITIVDPIFLIESICDPIFNKIHYNKMAAFLSCLIISNSFTTINSEFSKITDLSTKLYEQILSSIILKINNVMDYSKFKIQNKFSFQLCKIIESWVEGVNSTILFKKNLNINININMFKLFKELMIQTLKAAKILKNEEVIKNIKKIISIIKKDILFVELNIQN